MLKVTNPSYEDLNENEKGDVSNNGSGKEYACYIRVEVDGKKILLVNDAMEPEDASFCRSLSWVSGIIVKAYEIGKSERVKGGPMLPQETAGCRACRRAK